MAEASMVFKAYDDMSGIMKGIAANGKALNKEYEALELRMKALSSGSEQCQKKMGVLSKEIIEAKKTMKDAAKQFKRTGDEADGISLKKAVAEYERLSAEMKNTKLASDTLQRSMKNTAEDMRKMFDSGSMTSDSGGFLSKIFGTGLGANLAQAGIFRDLGNSMSGFAGTFIESKLGQPMATALSETLSGAVSGASAGIIAGGMGMAVGGAIGAASGMLNAGNQIFQQKDDAFKTYYKDLYDTTAAETDESVTSGRTLASSRETDEIAFSKLLGGADISKDYLAKVRDMANHTPFLYSDLTSMSKSLAPAFGSDPERMLELMQAIGDAGASVGLDTSGMQMVGTAISRMESTGKTTLEYLNILQERGIDAYGFLADGLSKSKEQMLEMVSKGLIPGAEAAQLIQQGMEGAYQGAMALQSHTSSGLASTLEGLRENVDAAGGAAYNDVHNRGLEAEIAAYDGPLGRALEKASEVSGANRAYLDNLQMQYQREALSSVLLGEDSRLFDQSTLDKLMEMRSQYLNAQERYDRDGDQRAGLDMEKVLEDTKALAASAFESSNEYQKKQQTEIDQVNDIRENVAGMRATMNSWDLNNVFSKGMASTWHYGGFATFGDAATATGGDVGVLEAIGAYDGSHAFGLRRVPYDGYRAVLHEGERVMTAAEARSAGGGDVINLNISGLTVRQDSDVTAIAAELFRMVEAAKLRAEG